MARFKAGDRVRIIDENALVAVYGRDSSGAPQVPCMVTQMIADIGKPGVVLNTETHGGRVAYDVATEKHPDGYVWPEAALVPVREPVPDVDYRTLYNLLKGRIQGMLIVYDGGHWCPRDSKEATLVKQALSGLQEGLLIDMKEAIQDAGRNCVE